MDENLESGDIMITCLSRNASYADAVESVQYHDAGKEPTCARFVLLLHDLVLSAFGLPWLINVTALFCPPRFVYLRF